MDMERTIEILLKNQARMDARFDAQFDPAEERFRKAEGRLDRLERGGLAYRCAAMYVA